MDIYNFTKLCNGARNNNEIIKSLKIDSYPQARNYAACDTTFIKQIFNIIVLEFYEYCLVKQNC